MKEIIITTTIGLLAFLSHRHYDFYKKLSDYLWIIIVVGIIAYGAYCFALDSIEDAILESHNEFYDNQLNDIIKKHQGNNLVVIGWFLGLGLVNYVLTGYPLWVKSHPYNKGK